MKAHTSSVHQPKSRHLPAESSTPLAVSGPRGVAAVLQSDGCRAMLFDLEEDEGNDDESRNESESSEDQEEDEIVDTAGDGRMP